jgi:DNA-directed RNA polymerase subunit K/omega
MKNYDSRHPQLDVEKCVALSGGNRFHMIIAASERARELKQKNRHSERVEHLHSPITALLEIQTGKTIG